MEAEGAKHIFEHSIKKHKLGYVEFLGNGNTKSYVNVKDIYPGIEIKKLECVGHYQKRVRTRLRNLKKKEKRLGGPRRLTDATIDRLYNYTGVAIRQNVKVWNQVSELHYFMLHLINITRITIHITLLA